MNMRYHEIIEKIETIGGIKVLIDPSVDVLSTFIEKSEYGELRGIYDGKSFYFWDASHLIHDKMAPQLGLDWYTRLELQDDSSGSFTTKLIDDNIPNIWHHPYFIKLKQLEA